MSYIHINFDELSDDDVRMENLFPPANYRPPSKIDDYLNDLIPELHRQNCAELAARMDRCRKGHRPEQRGASDPRRTFPECGLMFCPFCKRKHQFRRRSSKTIARTFPDDTTNQQCSLVTLHAVSNTVEALLAEHKWLSRIIRNARDQWANNYPEGSADWTNIKQLALVRVLEIQQDRVDRQVKGHWHMVIRHAGISRRDLRKWLCNLRKRLLRKWNPAAVDYAGAVHIKPLDENKSFTENRDYIVFDYCLKLTDSDGNLKFPDVSKAAEHAIQLRSKGSLKAIISTMAGSIT